MDEAFHVDTQVRRRATLRQARAAALAALQQYDVQVANVHFIQISDHITYKVETSTGERYLLRVHSESRSPNAILSELEWLKALNQTEQLVVPEGVANRSGSYVTDVGKQKGLHGWVTLMRWVEGEHLSGELTEGHVSNIGKLIARLHEATDTFVPSAAFVRSSWDDKSFQGDISRLEQHYSNFLSVEEFKLYRQAADKVLADLENLQNSGLEYGIIHADLHVGNLVFHQGEPYPIDFGRCGWGYYLYDVAQTLVGLYPLQRHLLVESYKTQRALHRDYVAALECFFIMSILENYSFHAPDPKETEGLIRQQPYAQALVRHYLSGEPFLFNSVKI